MCACGCVGRGNIVPEYEMIIVNVCVPSINVSENINECDTV